jgi:hypothetical protein
MSQTPSYAYKLDNQGANIGLKMHAKPNKDVYAECLYIQGDAQIHRAAAGKNKGTSPT